MSSNEDMLKNLVQCGLIEGYEMLDEDTAKIKFKHPPAWIGVDFGFEPDKQAVVLYDENGRVIENPFIDPAQIAERMGGKLGEVHGRPPIRKEDWQREYLAEYKPIDPDACVLCDGTGMRQNDDPNYPYYMTCHYCKGTGRKRIHDERACMCGSAKGHTTNARCSNCGGLIK